MRLVDANLLLYAHVASFPRHVPARDWLDRTLNGAAPVGMPWASLLAFVRIVSNPRVFAEPEPIAEAWTQVEEWLGCSAVWVPGPTDRHQAALAPLLTMAGMKPNLVPDAHLAALAIEHGLVLCTTDADFARFPGLRWENPLS